MLEVSSLRSTRLDTACFLVFITSEICISEDSVSEIEVSY